MVVGVEVVDVDVVVLVVDTKLIEEEVEAAPVGLSLCNRTAR